MIKKNKWELLASSIIILLPALLGLILWNKLPEQMTTHWGADGSADGWSVKALAVFGLPLFILVLHWVCVFFTVKDHKNKDQSKKVLGMIWWICPFLSVFANAITYAAAFGKDFNIGTLTLISIGLLFLVLGNYLPKCKQNYTIGIKVKWALQNEENWNATHRMGGKLWVIGGLIMMVCVFLPETFSSWVVLVLLPVLAVIPIVYSYAYHRKQLKEGTATITPIPKSKADKIVIIVIMPLVAVCLVFVGLLTYTGDINVNYKDDSFTIEASFWSDLTVDYDAIESIEYREYDDPGSRTNGLGGAKLLAGAFRNEEFGNYTRYSYVGCDACVVLSVDGKTLVINGADSESTRNIYDELIARK